MPTSAVHTCQDAEFFSANSVFVQKKIEIVIEIFMILKHCKIEVTRESEIEESALRALTAEKRKLGNISRRRVFWSLWGGGGGGGGA